MGEFKVMVCSLCIGIMGIYLFNEFLNLFPIVRKEVIYIEDLPDEFEGFTILQFSDLHGKTFGRDQWILTRLINKQSFDMIAITGDVVDRHDPDLTPFFDVLEGIESDAPQFFVKGNIDSLEDVEIIRQHGLEMLDEPYVFNRNGKELLIKQYVWNTVLGDEFDDKVVIGLGHEPLPQNLGYDLILVGHYHGGQIRIPGYGAIFIPNIDGQQWFPDQSDVMGLKQFEGYSQYITAGLGASASSKWLQKRWFNPPEINLITLTNQK